jgi:hypothetical protein
MDEQLGDEQWEMIAPLLPQHQLRNQSPNSTLSYRADVGISFKERILGWLQR